MALRMVDKRLHIVRVRLAGCGVFTFVTGFGGGRIKSVRFPSEGFEAVCKISRGDDGAHDCGGRVKRLDDLARTIDILIFVKICALLAIFE